MSVGTIALILAGIATVATFIVSGFPRIGNHGQQGRRHK